VDGAGTHRRAPSAPAVQPSFVLWSGAYGGRKRGVPGTRCARQDVPPQGIEPRISRCRRGALAAKLRRRDLVEAAGPSSPHSASKTRVNALCRLRRGSLRRIDVGLPSRSREAVKAGAPGRIRTCTVLFLREPPPADWATGALIGMVPAPRDRTWNLPLTRRALSPFELYGR
jgi:hypothetical protein